MSNVDKDGNGDIDFDEFKDLMRDQMSKRKPEEEFRRAFRLFDMDDTGFITFENLKRAAEELHENEKDPNAQKLPDDALKQMIYEADRDRKGKVSLEDFLHMLKKSN